MAKKKNRYEGMSYLDIESFKLQKKYTMILVVVFMFLIFSGIMLSITNACSWYTDEELGIVSGTSAGQTVSSTETGLTAGN